MLTVPAGFTIERIAVVAGARELAITRSGDLYIGTSGHNVYMIAHADAEHPSAPSVYRYIEDAPAAGVAVYDNAVYIGGQFGVYVTVPSAADTHRIVSVRTSGASSDHVTTSVAADGQSLFTSVGSSCNACRPELDDTRATIVSLDLKGNTRVVARDIRNAIALAINPDTGALWAGVAGADDLPLGHPYEIFDDVTAHSQPVDYGWPGCYDNRKPVAEFPRNCANVAIPRVVFPAYDTPIGASFYPQHPGGAHAFPSRYHGGAFVALHGSWHGPAEGLHAFVPPRIAFVPMHNDEPLRAVNWSDPSAQWEEFVTGFQVGDTGARIARPTGVTVGPDGSLYFSDDFAGGIYRVRPSVRR